MHLVYFRPFPEPTLSYWDAYELAFFDLKGEVRIQFQDVKSCIGYYDGKEHHKCINSTMDVKQCPYCSFRDISRVYTRMDMKGFEHLEEEIVNRPYSIYLAYFGKDVVKCGVCRKERLETRLREQGASYYVHLMDFENANDTYSMEKLIQHTFGFKNAVRNSTKLKVLKEQKPEILEESFEQVKKMEPFSDLVLDSKVQKIDYKLPEEFSIIKESIDGKIKTRMGSFLFFSNNGDNFAIDLKSKIGEHFRFI